jgi:hypothetical protein
MKKIILLAAIPMLLLSCKKNKSDNLPENTITATINDTDYVFNTNFASETFINPPEIAYVALAADSTLALASSFDFAVIMLNGKPITPGVYIETGDPGKTASAELQVQGSTSYETAGTKTDPFTITVTSINSTSVQGTFHGSIYEDGDSLKTKKVITNGKFNMNR